MVVHRLKNKIFDSEILMTFDNIYIIDKINRKMSFYQKNCSLSLPGMWSQLTFTCTKSTIETLEKCVKFVQS